MGTEGYMIFRHDGYYFLWHRSHDGYHEEPGIGWELWTMIPQGKDKFEDWAQKKRSALARIREEYDEDETKWKEQNMGDYDADFSITRSYPPPGQFVHHEYLVDLDRLIFSINKTPTFHLDNMPPLDIYNKAFEAEEEADEEESDFVESVPEEYRFDPIRLPVPEIPGSDDRLRQYARFCKGIVTTSHDILSLRATLSPCEQVCLRLLENYLSVYFLWRKGLIVREVILGPDLESMGEDGREIAVTLAASALLPLHLLDTGRPRDTDRWAKHYAGHQDDFWFIRKHICLRITKHLHDKRNLQANISDTVNKILSTKNGPTVVYGVIFSLVSCVVVRVDKAAGGFFDHTEVLPFFPVSADAKTCPTPGMELLRRLGNLRAVDDVDWFYSKLSSMESVTDSIQIIYPMLVESKETQESPKKKQKISSDEERPEAGKGLTPPRLPFEILRMIAGCITDPDCLHNLALASRETMAASIPRLRYPQVRGEYTCIKSRPFSSQVSFACILEYYEEPLGLYEPGPHSSAYHTRFLDFPAHVAIAPDGMGGEPKDGRASKVDVAMGLDMPRRSCLIPNCSEDYKVLDYDPPLTIQEILHGTRRLWGLDANRRFVRNETHPKMEYMLFWTKQTTELRWGPEETSQKEGEVPEAQADEGGTASQE